MEGRSLKIYTKFVWDARIRVFGRSWVILEDCLLTSTGTFEYSQYFKLTWSSSDSDFLVKIWIHNSKRYFKNTLWWPFLEKTFEGFLVINTAILEIRPRFWVYRKPTKHWLPGQNLNLNSGVISSWFFSRIFRIDRPGPSQERRNCKISFFRFACSDFNKNCDDVLF